MLLDYSSLVSSETINSSFCNCYVHMLNFLCLQSYEEKLQYGKINSFTFNIYLYEVSIENINTVFSICLEIDQLIKIKDVFLITVFCINFVKSNYSSHLDSASQLLKKEKEMKDIIKRNILLQLPPKNIEYCDLTVLQKYLLANYFKEKNIRQHSFMDIIPRNDIIVLPIAFPFHLKSKYDDIQLFFSFNFFQLSNFNTILSFENNIDLIIINSLTLIFKDNFVIHLKNSEVNSYNKIDKPLIKNYNLQSFRNMNGEKLSINDPSLQLTIRNKSSSNKNYIKKSNKKKSNIFGNWKRKFTSKIKQNKNIKRVDEVPDTLTILSKPNPYIPYMSLFDGYMKMNNKEKLKKHWFRK